MQRIKLIAILGVMALVLTSAVIFYAFPTSASPQKIATTHLIKIDEAIVHIALADSLDERERGLSGIGGLAPDEGMLFVFDKDGQYRFWMKDMLFAIDMFWIAADGSVVHIEHSVTPDSFPRTFTSEAPAMYVLEVIAGFAAQHGIKEGSKLQF